uniref:Protein ZIP4 homolog n=1 Tax=Coturnix japonica TaxID=93934 RepID=A0A8C2TRU5_COTJA
MEAFSGVNFNLIQTHDKIKWNGILSQVEEGAISLWNWAVTKHTSSVINDEQRAKCMYAFFSFLNVFVCCSVERKSSLLTGIYIVLWVVWMFADRSIEKLYAKLRKEGNGEADIHVCKADVEKDLFKVLSYQAESAVAQGDFQKAMQCVQRCKDMLVRLPRETRYLAILCYNFGVETYDCKKYEQMLRLLATAYFEWDCSLYLDKALKAINLANEENLHPAGFFLKVKILLKSGASDEDISSGMTVLYCLLKFLSMLNRESVGFDFLKSVAERFEASPDFGKVTLLYIEFLLQNKRELLAKQKVEEIIIGHYTGKQLLPETLNRLHIILWDTAAKHYEVWNCVVYSEALNWYNYSVSFYTPGQIDQNLAKLQRNMASCYLHLKQIDKAKEAVKEAERCDPNSIFTQFSVYKIAVMENDTDKETEQVHFHTDCALLVFQNDQQVVAIRALEHLSEHSQDCRQVFAALNHRRHLTIFCSACKLPYIGSIPITCSYFCFQLSQFCPSDKAVLIAQKTCLLMAAAIDLELGRQEVTPSEQVGCCSVASLDIYHICHSIWKSIFPIGDFSKDPTDTLLLLYEFEARSKLNDPTLNNFMESVWEQPHEIKTLEIIASLAMEPPARYPVLCKKALKSALNLYRKQTTTDAGKFSKCLHSLINLSLPTGVMDLDACVLQEVWGYFEDALSVVSSTGSYPEMEILWLMTRAWNTGIFQYTIGKYQEAEQWCGLGMRFLNHLGSLKKSYEGHVSVSKWK